MAGFLRVRLGCICLVREISLAFEIELWAVSFGGLLVRCWIWVLFPTDLEDGRVMERV